MNLPRQAAAVGLAALFVGSGCGDGGVTPVTCSAEQSSVVGSERSFCMEFFQADREADNGVEVDSPLGVAELHFDGEPGLLHFNLEVNGVARVINTPILSFNGSVRHAFAFGFDLNVDAGTDVSQLQFAADLTKAPLGTASLPVQAADVKPMDIVLLSGVFNEPLLLAEPPAPLDGGRGAADGARGHANANFPNQEQKKNECVPAAVSNSLQFLNRQHNLRLTDDQMSIETWKEALGFRATGTPGNWPATKAAFLASAGYPVTSKTSIDVAEAIRALDSDCDVEMWVSGHAAALVEITETRLKGRYSITTMDDARQGKAGGTKPQKGYYNTRYSSPGKIHGGVNGMDGKKLKKFVIQCPSSQ